VAYKLDDRWIDISTRQKYTEIYRDDKDIARADILFQEDGWNIAVKSNVAEGIKVAEAAQNPDSDWTVKDYRPDLVEPFVLSFVAVAER